MLNSGTLMGNVTVKESLNALVKKNPTLLPLYYQKSSWDAAEKSLTIFHLASVKGNLALQKSLLSVKQS